MRSSRSQSAANLWKSSSCDPEFWVQVKLAPSLFRGRRLEMRLEKVAKLERANRRRRRRNPIGRNEHQAIGVYKEKETMGVG